LALTSALGVGGLLTSGCDPEVNVYGSFFPAWVLALAVGGLLTAALRWVLASLRLEPHLGPLLVIYPALAFAASCSAWLFLFGP
jgi:hypothetical protein